MNTIRQDYERWLVRRLQPRTVARYLQVLDDFRAYLQTDEDFGKREVEDADRGVIFRFLNREASRSPHRFNAERSALVARFEYAELLGLVRENPARKIDAARTRRVEKQPLSLSEYLDLRAAVANVSKPTLRSRNQAIIDVLFHSAVRVSELVAMDVADFRPASGDGTGASEHVITGIRTKGDHELCISLNDLAAASLEEWIRDRDSFELDPSEKAIFVSSRRRRISVRAVQLMLKKCAAAAGVPRTTCHLLRHSAITLLHKEGVEIATLAELAGHASIRTTQRYIKVDSEDRRRAVNTLADSTRRAMRTRSVRRARTTPKEEPR